MSSEPIMVPKWVWIGLLILGLLGLGLLISPKDSTNRPILLLPDAKAVEDYHISIEAWDKRMQSLDAEISTVLSGKFGSDLFTKSREAQKVVEETVQLAQEIDRKDVPTAAIPAKSLLVQSANAYLNASRVMLQWVTAPTDENMTDAQDALAQARKTLDQLEQSQWINR
jgi:hypothetical protein